MNLRVAALALVSVAMGCGESNEPRSGSETHLVVCDTHADCVRAGPGRTCVEGVCRLGETTEELAGVSCRVDGDVCTGDGGGMTCCSVFGRPFDADLACLGDEVFVGCGVSWLGATGRCDGGPRVSCHAWPTPSGAASSFESQTTWPPEFEAAHGITDCENDVHQQVTTAPECR